MTMNDVTAIVSAIEQGEPQVQERPWAYARAWLYAHLREGEGQAAD
jgi:hypothetical protein